MKRLLNILALFAVAMFFLAGCEKNTSTEDVSTITYYVTFDLEGDPVMNVELGQDYVEPGFVAMEGETDVTGQVDIAGTVDSSTPGLYELTYSAVNADGYESSASRTVIVYDPTAPDTDISGTYTASIIRTEADGSSPRPYSGAVNITKIAQGIFYVDDLLGGTYAIAFGYGSAYAMTGYVALNADNTITLLSSFVQGWGDGLEGFQNGEYSETTGLPYWESIYASGDIYAVTLKN